MLFLFCSYSLIADHKNSVFFFLFLQATLLSATINRNRKHAQPNPSMIRHSKETIILEYTMIRYKNILIIDYRSRNKGIALFLFCSTVSMFSLELEEGHERIIHNLFCIHCHDKISMSIILYVLHHQVITIMVFEIA